MKLRLLLDQNLRVETKGFLADLGLDVVSTRDLGMARSTDTEIAAWARTEGRIVVTFNADFSDCYWRKGHTRHQHLRGFHPNMAANRIASPTRVAGRSVGMNRKAALAEGYGRMATRA